MPLIDINQQNLFDFSVSVDWVERGETQLIKLQKINMGYRHLQTPGASYFFALITYQRKKIVVNDKNIQLLREAFHQIKIKHSHKIR